VNIWQQINESAAGAVATVQRAVVQIVTAEGATGAGVIWRSDGLIITSAHVVVGRQPRRDLRVLLADGTTHPARVLAYDQARDLAALSIPAQGLPVIVPGQSQQVRAGQWLMALGHPWGTPDALTAGVVIGTGSALPESDGRNWLALDAHMRPGHSGGPVFDADGRLFGINTMIRGPQVSFAVPVDEVVAFLSEAAAGGAALPGAPEAVPAPRPQYV
jgi:S1-C subfamily serine protease